MNSVGYHWREVSNLKLFYEGLSSKYSTDLFLSRAFVDDRKMFLRGLQFSDSDDSSDDVQFLPAGNDEELLKSMGLPTCFGGEQTHSASSQLSRKCKKKRRKKKGKPQNDVPMEQKEKPLFEQIVERDDAAWLKYWNTCGDAFVDEIWNAYKLSRLTELQISENQNDNTEHNDTISVESADWERFLDSWYQKCYNDFVIDLNLKEIESLLSSPISLSSLCPDVATITCQCRSLLMTQKSVPPSRKDYAPRSSHYTKNKLHSADAGITLSIVCQPDRDEILCECCDWRKEYHKDIPVNRRKLHSVGVLMDSLKQNEEMTEISEDTMNNDTSNVPCHNGFCGSSVSDHGETENVEVIERTDEIDAEEIHIENPPFRPNDKDIDEISNRSSDLDHNNTGTIEIIETERSDKNDAEEIHIDNPVLFDHNIDEISNKHAHNGICGLSDIAENENFSHNESDALSSHNSSASDSGPEELPSKSVAKFKKSDDPEIKAAKRRRVVDCIETVGLRMTMETTHPRFQNCPSLRSARVNYFNKRATQFDHELNFGYKPSHIYFDDEGTADTSSRTLFRARKFLSSIQGESIDSPNEKSDREMPVVSLDSVDVSLNDSIDSPDSTTGTSERIVTAFVDSLLDKVIETSREASNCLETSFHGWAPLLSSTEECDELDATKDFTELNALETNLPIKQRCRQRRKGRLLKKLPPDVAADKTLCKYWAQRYRLFSKFDEGILIDKDGWWSVTPEEIAKHVAERCRADIVIDAFCGHGGNAIQFAFTCERVITFDLYPEKLEMARHNARIYGVEDRIDFVLGDYMLLGPLFKADAVFLSPPWGGPNYLNVDVFDIATMDINGFDVFEVTRKITENICFFVPRNTNIEQMVSLAGTNGKVEIEQNFLNKKMKTLCCYYGDLIYTENDACL